MNTKVLNRPVGYCMFYLCAETKIGLSSLYFIYLFIFVIFLFWFCKDIMKWAQVGFFLFN